MFRRKPVANSSDKMKQRSSSTTKIKSILFEHRVISRQNIIELSQLNPRTVSRCMETLESQGIVKLSKQNVSLGQPQIIYTLQQEHICFMTLTVMPLEIYALLCDNRGFPVEMIHQQYPAGEIKNKLPGILVNTAKKLTAALTGQGRKPYSGAVNLAGGIIAGPTLKNKLINLLQPYCMHDVICGYADEFLLSQYAINHHLSGRVLGLIHKNHSGWQHVAVNNAKLDPTAALRVSKLLENVTDFSCGCKLSALLNFNFFVKHRYEEYYRKLRNIAETIYSEVYSRANNGDAGARRILEDYADLLFETMKFLRPMINPDHLILMHSRPIIIDKLQSSIQAAGDKFPAAFECANFASNEFIYSPAGYLRRELFPFEHGKILKNFHE